MKLLGFTAALALATFTFSGPAAAAVVTFDDPVATGATQAPGTWYTDRYAPAGFTGGVAFDGREVLQVDISSADGADDRPAAFSSAFYNTQGRKLDLAEATTAMSIELYVGEDWGTTGRRMAGFWGTAFSPALPPASNDVYPIIEFTSEGGTGRFRGWDSGAGWTDFGLPSGFAYGSWNTLSIALQGGNWVYSVGDASLSVNAYGAEDISNVILQAHNTAQGVDYSVRWDNFNAVPEPGTWALMILGFGLTGAAMRRRAALAA